MKRGLAIGLIVAVAVVVGVGAFFGGRATAGTPSPQEAMKVIQNLTQAQLAALLQNGGGAGLFGGTGRTNGTGGTGTRANGGGFTTGSIISKDTGSITIKSSDGNTKTVYFSGSTTISKSTDVSSDALTVGEAATVTGTSNTDGSVTATRITLGTLGFGGPGQGGATGSATTGTTASGAASSGN
jgi:hypothetical protein